LPLSEQSEQGARIVEGAIALSEARFADAKALLQPALAYLTRIAAATPIARGMGYVVSAMLAEAEARLGCVVEAQRILSECEAPLRRVRYAHLVDWASNAIAAAAC
jgi:hypothetical protein